MVADQSVWGNVARGLEFKLAGLILFAGVPMEAVLVWLTNLDPRWLLLGVALAAAPDLVGRCLCLAAPLPNHLTIALSVVAQASAFVAIAAFGGFVGGPIGVSIGIFLAGGLQFTAAALFILFLQAAGDALGHAGASTGADLLGWRLTYSLAAVWGFGFAAFLVAGVVLVGTMVTLGYGFYVCVLVGALLLLPVALMTVGAIMAMYWTYGSTMVHLRAAIREQERKAASDYAVGLDAQPTAAADPAS